MKYFLRILGFLWLLPATVVVWLFYILPLMWRDIEFVECVDFLIFRFQLKSKQSWYAHLWKDWLGWSGPCVVITNDFDDNSLYPVPKVISSAKFTGASIKELNTSTGTVAVDAPLGAAIKAEYTYTNSPLHALKQPGGDLLRAEIKRKTIIHEARHCAQQFVFGPLFYPVYFLCSAVLWIEFAFGRKIHAYLDNPFERDARKVAGQQVDIPSNQWPSGSEDSWPWW